MKAKAYSLWIMPEGHHNILMKMLISKLARKYGSPEFEPHVTLLGEIDDNSISEKTIELTKILPFEIKAHQVEFMDFYFRCLFLRFEESSELIRLNQKAREIFNREHDPLFMPHLSLMYGNFSSQIKTNIINEVGPMRLKIMVDKIYLYKTEGEPNQWYKIKEYGLSPS